jgi:LacI family transcriptional regulator
MATIQEISERCGVSVSTVSKALNGYSDISNKTKELVIKTANEMGYFPSVSTKSVKAKKTYNIGVLFNTLSNLGLKNDYFAHVLECFKEEASQHGYNISFIEQHVGQRRMTYLDYSRCRHFDGICILCADYEKDEVIALINSELPVVTIDYSFQKAFSIISDNYEGMKRLTNYILRQGHTRIAMIHGVNSLVTRNRIDGFIDTMEENKLTVPQEYLRESLYRNSLIAEEQTIKLLQLPNRPTCILAPDDTAAMGVISGIRKCGLQVVKDISVAGYDGFDVAKFIGIKLTTVKQDREAIGREAARRLIQMIESNQQIPLETVFVKQTLVMGNSVKKLD